MKDREETVKQTNQQTNRPHRHFVSFSGLTTGKTSHNDRPMPTQGQRKRERESKGDGESREGTKRFGGGGGKKCNSKIN